MKVLLLFLLLAFTAHAQSIKEGKAINKWEAIAKATDVAANAYFAPDSIRRNGNVIKLWAKWDFPDGLVAPAESEQRGMVVGSIRSHLTLNCKGKSVRAAVTAIYGIDGSLIATERKAEINETPGSIGNIIFSYFCEREPNTTGPPKLKSTP